MRDILFRAKRTDNREWVYGNYAFCDCYTNQKHYIFQNKPLEYAVDESTLCQYTGLTDKNGLKIWENDIVKRTDLHRVGEPSIGIIEYDIENTGFVIHWIDNPKYSPTYPWRDRIAVVGNIFDTTELLKEE